VEEKLRAVQEHPLHTCASVDKLSTPSPCRRSNTPWGDTPKVIWPRPRGDLRRTCDPERDPAPLPLRGHLVDSFFRAVVAQHTSEKIIARVSLPPTTTIMPRLFLKPRGMVWNAQQRAWSGRPSSLSCWDDDSSWTTAGSTSDETTLSSSSSCIIGEHDDSDNVSFVSSSSSGDEEDETDSVRSDKVIDCRVSCSSSDEAEDDEDFQVELPDSDSELGSYVVDEELDGNGPKQTLRPPTSLVFMKNQWKMNDDR
jgi:hypothetical protein